MSHSFVTFNLSRTLLESVLLLTSYWASVCIVENSLFLIQLPLKILISNTINKFTASRKNSVKVAKFKLSNKEKSTDWKKIAAPGQQVHSPGETAMAVELNCTRKLFACFNIAVSKQKVEPNETFYLSSRRSVGLAGSHFFGQHWSIWRRENS